MDDTMAVQATESTVGDETTSAGTTNQTSDKTLPEANVDENSAVTVEETEYTADEFAAAADKLFGKTFTSHLVKAAFIFNGVTKATKADGIKIVNDFAKRKVE